MNARSVPATKKARPRPSDFRANVEHEKSLKSIGFRLHGNDFPAKYANEVLIKVFIELRKHYPDFFEKFASLEKHGTSRRYLGRSPDELFPNRPDLAQKKTHWRKISSGWYIDIHESKLSIKKIIKLACEVAGIEYGKELIINLG